MNQPVIFYQGNTIAHPGDPVVLRGTGFNDIKSALLRRKEKSEEVKLLQHRADSLKFFIPEEFEEGVYELDLQGDFGTETLHLNAPVVRFVQGDHGEITSPGGFLRLVGECMRIGEHPVRAALDGNPLKMAYAIDDYCAEIRLPADLSEGTHQLVYGNSEAFCDPITVKVGPDPRSAWPDTVFTVQGGKVTGDKTEQIQQLLKQIEDNGGGILYFPRGSYEVTGSFVIPPKTRIRGEGTTLVNIWWNGYKTDEMWKIDELPDVMLTCTTEVSVEDVTFSGTRLGHFMVNRGEGKDIYVQRVRVHADPEGGTNTHRDENGQKRYMAIRRENMRFETDLFRFHCTNLQITDCRFIWPGRPVGSGNNRYVLYRSNEFNGIKTHDNWMPLGYMEEAIIEDNLFQNYTMGASGRNIYFARNRICHVMDNNREAFTTDMGGGTEYHGGVEKLSDTRYRFPEESGVKELEKLASEYNLYKAMYILSGTGMGQCRKVIAFDGDTVEIESPFTVEPDASSHCSVNALNENWYMPDNECEDAGHYQFYVPQVNTVVDHLCCRFAGGFSGWGMRIYHGWNTQWYISVLNCDLSDGYYYHMKSQDACILLIRGLDPAETTTIANVMKNNRLSENAELLLNGSQKPHSLIDTVICGNRVSVSDRGLTVTGVSKDTLIANNKMDKVDRPYLIPDGQEGLLFTE